MSNQYRVIAGACPVVNQKEILQFGDVRDADFFEDAEALVKKGFLTPVEEVEPIKHVLTADDIARNPQLADEGLKEGDEIELPYDGLIEADGTTEKGKKKATKK